MACRRTNLASATFPFPSALSLFVVLCAATSSACGRSLVLRDVTVLRNVHVQSFDLDGVLLQKKNVHGGKLVTWDEIESWSLETLAAEQAADAE